MKPFAATVILAISGFALATLGFHNLSQREEGIRHHRNPFAIQQSGFGMTLARLSQDTVNTVWHLGIESVNPETHVHGPECAHLPGHGGHGEDPEGDPHDHPGHDHGEHEEHAHAGHDHAGHEEHEHAGNDHAGHEESGHVHGPHCEHGDHHDHVHGPHCDHGDHHDHDHGPRVNPITAAKDWLQDLKAARYARTNPYGISEGHRLAIARDIEETLLRSYRMDPSNYGVYNAYFLFLTIHELRATPRAKEHARRVSDTTIAKAFQEEVNPAPWLTASIAVLNLFFLDQEGWREEGIDPPAGKLHDYKQRMGFCLQQYAVLKEKAIAEKRWEQVPEERRRELDERENFAVKAFAQFDAMLARSGAPADELTESRPSDSGVGSMAGKTDPDPEE